MHRHKYVGRKLGRDKGHRKAMLKNLAASLILHERIQTTVAKAKEIRPIVEKIITKGKKGDLASRRQLLKYLPENATAKVMEKLSPEYKERAGGYLRILKSGFRVGDAAPTAIIEFVDYNKEEAKSKKEKIRISREERKKEKEKLAAEIAKGRKAKDTKKTSVATKVATKVKALKEEK